MSNDIYKKYNVNLSKLKRDYLKNPLKKITVKSPTGYKLEKPYKEDIEYLYIDLNIPMKEISNYLNIGETTLRKWFRYFNIRKNYKLTQQLLKKTKLEKYGDENYNNSKKRKQTKLEKYGDENYNNRKLALITNNNLYNGNSPLCSEIIQKKSKETLIKKYGVDNYFKSNKHKNIMNLNRKKINQKIFITKQKNNQLGNNSKEEKIILNLLLQKYPLTKYQYKSKEYPFICDFYIPEIDTYIEYQGYFTHGKNGKKILGPYDSKNPEHTSLLNEWIEKSKELNSQGKLKEQYNIAINVWTISDPLKRETAKKNNLNWIEFFTIDDFMNWYNLL